MRFKTLSPADLKEDVAWKTAMPRAYRVLVGRAHLAAPPALPLRRRSALRATLCSVYWMTAASLAPSSIWASTRLAAISRADEQDFGFERHGRTRDGPPSLVRAVNVCLPSRFQRIVTPRSRRG